MAHPECRTEVLALADLVTSTSGMLGYVRESNDNHLLLAQRWACCIRCKRKSGKGFYPASEDMQCPDMKKITLEDVGKPR